MFSCEICEIFNNSFFYRAPPVAASDSNILQSMDLSCAGGCVYYQWIQYSGDENESYKINLDYFGNCKNVNDLGLGGVLW